MKKFLAIAFSMLFVLGLTGTAFAIHAEIPSETQAIVAKGTTQVTLGGALRFRGEMKEVDFDDETPTDSIYDGRVRLSVDAKVADNVQGFVQVEAGNGDTKDSWTWGEDADGAKGVYTEGNAKRGEIDVLEAWILFKNDIMNLKVGHMPLALGNKLFFDHTKFGDDAIVLYKDIDNVHIGLLTAKFGEDGTAAADDGDAYVALVTYKGSGFNLGADVTWVDDNSFVTSTDAYNIGLRGDVTVGPATIKGDVELQTGSIEEASADGEDIDINGWAVMLGAGMKAGNVNLVLEGVMGSGDDLEDDNNWTNGGEDFDRFITSLGADKHYTYVYEYRATSACGGTGTGVCNTTYVRLGANANVTDALNIAGDLYWLKATEDITNGAGELEDDLGWEIDAKATYKLAKNLVYWVEGGYLFAGDAYNGMGTNDDDESDDAWAIRHGIELTF